jgi:hypothetical protein
LSVAEERKLRIPRFQKLLPESSHHKFLKEKDNKISFFEKKRNELRKIAKKMGEG